MNLAVFGISFRSAAIKLREQVSFSPEAIPAILRRLARDMPRNELALVSTCNRTELYAAGADAPPDVDAVISRLVGDDPAADIDELAAGFYTKTGLEAVEHVLAVTSSLDSMVIGESEILGQVRQAYGLAVQEQSNGKILDSVFHAAFRTAKRVHTETEIARGRVSVSSIAVEFAEKVFEKLGEKTVMIVGAGETADLALKSLVERGAREVLVLNRSFDRGRALAEQYGGRAIPFEQLPDNLAQADIVITSTAAPHCVIHADMVRRAVAARRQQPILLIDIAVPRDIAADVGDLENTYLYDIDDLRRVADENMVRRQAAVEQAWQIVREETAELVALFREPDIGPMMRHFDRYGREACDELVERTLGREKLAALDEEGREEIRALSGKIANALLDKPRRALRRAARNGGWEGYVRMVNDLFGFEEDDPPGSRGKGT